MPKPKRGGPPSSLKSAAVSCRKKKKRGGLLTICVGLEEKGEKARWPKKASPHRFPKPSVGEKRSKRNPQQQRKKKSKTWALEEKFARKKC